MGGVVYAGFDGDLGRFGEPISLASGAVIPPGVYYITGNWNIVLHAGTADQEVIGPISSGLCISDGTCTAAAAVSIVPVGAKGQKPDWPWPEPWPLDMTVP